MEKSEHRSENAIKRELACGGYESDKAEPRFAFTWANAGLWADGLANGKCYATRLKSEI
jgi:hypothetical protein